MPIDFVIEDRIALITINRPERRNALDEEHYHLLSEAWARVRDDAGIRAAVVTGAGDRAFCAGADIKSLLPNPVPLSEMWLTQKDLILNRGMEIWKPVVAAVNGACMGGGVCMLLATDVRIAVPGARFALAEVKRGLVPGNGATQRILGQLPYPIAMEFMLTGDAIDAETAARWGLINRIVEPGKLMESAFEVARRICRNAPLAVQAAKELAIRARDVDLNTGIRMELVMNRMLWETEDLREGASAFAEKREPNFKGR
ncbi:MAG: enoyl-CoA hydratase/isomerase family protein [Burkholderiales bacterium]